MLLFECLLGEFVTVVQRVADGWPEELFLDGLVHRDRQLMSRGLLSPRNFFRGRPASDVRLADKRFG